MRDAAGLIGPVICAMAAALWFSAGGYAVEYNNDLFPKIANISISSNADYGDAVSHARYDINVLGFWRGWNGGTSSIRATLRSIKALNPHILLGKYTCVMEKYSDPNNTAQRDIYDKLFAETGPGGKGDWWARDSNGEPVSSYPGTWATNITRFVTPDADGNRFPEWLAKRENEVFFAPVPELDIWYVDNVFYRPRAKADWDGDGVNDSIDDPAVRQYYREGIADYFAAIRALQPNLFLMGNIDGPLADTRTGHLNDPEYRGKLDGALYEMPIGRNWSHETWGSWQAMMQNYRHLLANTKEPHLVIFGAGIAPGDYKTARYIIGSALLDNGYVAIAEGTSYNSRLWFDEYDLAGAASSKWLGKAVDPPPTEPWSKGVYRRRFENGMVLVNPKGNGTQTVTIEPGYRRILGVQDPVTNNGQPATEITLAERDGIVLVREGLTAADIHYPAGVQVDAAYLKVHVPEPERIKSTVLPVEFTTTLPAAAVNYASVSVDGKLIAAGPQIPVGLTIDSKELADGLHDIAVQVSTTYGRTLSIAGRFYVRNRWRFHDAIEAPLEMKSWWSDEVTLVDRHKTSDRSAGWQYATDRPEDFAGDANRLVRVADTQEYLTWEAQGVTGFSLSLFARSAGAAKAVSLAVSADGSTWVELPFDVQASALPETEWQQLTVTGVVPDEVATGYLRLTLKAGVVPADALQVGALEMAGKEPWAR